MQFLTLLDEVLDQRERDGVRGIDRERIGITRRVRWHDLRHTCATNLIVIHAWRLELVQKVMGHSSITITQRYAHLTEDAIANAVIKSNEAMAVVETKPIATQLPEPPPGFFERVVGRLFGRMEATHV